MVVKLHIFLQNTIKLSAAVMSYRVDNFFYLISLC